MVHLSLSFAAAIALLLSAVPADAATRTTCKCDGRDKGFLHHKNLCEITFGYMVETADTIKTVSGKTCSADEAAQFKTWYCVQNKCLYPDVKRVE